MPVEIKKDPWVLVTNAVIALAILALVWQHVIDWKAALGGLGLLLAPSIAKRARGDEPTAKSNPKDDDKDPPAGGSGGLPIIVTPIMLFLLALALASSGCSVFTKENARTALDVAQVTCIIANASSDDGTVAAVCGVADALLPDLRTILGRQREAVARTRRLGSAPCADSGAP